MIKKIYDKCVLWAGHRYAKPFLAFESFIESFFFPIPPDVMIVPMVIARKNEFIRIALIATIFSVLGGLFGYLIGYVFFNELGFKIFELYVEYQARIFYPSVFFGVEQKTDNSEEIKVKISRGLSIIEKKAEFNPYIFGNSQHKMDSLDIFFNCLAIISIFKEFLIKGK